MVQREFKFYHFIYKQTVITDNDFIIVYLSYFSSSSVL